MLPIKSLRGLLWVSLVLGVAASPVSGASPVSRKSPKPSTKNSPAKTEPRKLIVYYFHGNARCMTCRKFETLTKELMDTRFEEEVKQGRVEYRVVNVDDPGNAHFIKDYALYTKSVVLSETSDGEEITWKNLDKIWEKVRNEDAYRRYVEDEVRSYLKRS
ncbi:MAG TPA: nitrophenyl compound nitroreductase subunit ArsF family protein [Elusimicrobiota bacterium]|nr:nitrophenyl compound nitroreductase subunit ArsF family protein [Elusimicrobiota bacterium]